MQTRHQEQSEAAGMKRSESTVRGCDLKDCRAVIRIFNQDFHNPSRYKGKGGDTHISSSALPAVGKASSEALKKGNLNVLCSEAGALQGVESKGFSGTAQLLFFVCTLKMMCSTAFEIARKKRSSSSVSSYRCTHSHLSKK